MSKAKLYVAAVVAGLIAVNGVLHVVADPTVALVAGLLTQLGLYVAPSPVLRHEE